MADAHPTIWLVGGGGLLGRAVQRTSDRGGLKVHRSRVPWSEPHAAVEALSTDARRLLVTGGDVVLVWCAGAGVVATEEQVFQQEIATLRAAVDVIADQVAESGCRLRVFLASSAGGVYAGSEHPPFDEQTDPRPLAPYGHAKLATEAVVRRLADRGVSVLIGRIANLYGPGQNLAKPQGLIAHLCRAQSQRSPLTMYVSLDTARDYIYADDAAAMILAGLERLGQESPGTVAVKIIASHQPTTLASLLGELHRISRRKPPVILGAAPSSAYQTLDLRFRSAVWNDLDRHAATTLSAGIHATLEDVATQLRAPGGTAA